MRGHVNDRLRKIIGWAITVSGLLSHHLLRFRLPGGLNQKRLKGKYGIGPDTPVLAYGPRVKRSIQKAAHQAGRGARFAKTSGSTGKAKEILYTRRRLLTLKLIFSDMFARACYAFRIKRTTLYVFNSFQTDASLTSLLLDEHALPNYFSTLQAPYRVEHHPAIKSLVSNYGAAAIRLWILTISNPGVLYSTNPSTISTFLDELASDWQRNARLVKDWHQDPASFSPELRRIACRLESRGSANRLKQIATSDVPLGLSVWAPAVTAYVCWTGGYVKAFLDRLATHLPASQYRLIPMYSMSTETIETLPYFRGEDVAFFPMASGVVYEFVEENEPDYALNLLNAQQLEPGKLYAMVVSDAYGLRRYQTDDLFLCKRKLRGRPDLVFVRRRSLEYSFTGEKLTAGQLSTVFEQLLDLYPCLVADGFLTCVPSHSAHACPHYEVILIGDRPQRSSYDALATRCDELLSEINCEYKSKRASGRLGPVTFMTAPLKDFPTQFKSLPLYRHMDDIVGASLCGRPSAGLCGSKGRPRSAAPTITSRAYF